VHVPSGLRVIELARILAGPWAGQTLADLGAEVIKVEAPEGDDTRRWGPPFIDREGQPVAAYFHSANRGKRSVVADFRTPEGQAKVKDLIAGADVLIENFKVGGLAKYGLDYASLSALNPRPDLLFDHRLRAGRALCAPGGLRLHHSGHVGPDVDHRPGGGRAASRRRRRHRPGHRHLFDHRDSCRAA
jgi:hypothetical protein